MISHHWYHIPIKVYIHLQLNFFVFLDHVVLEKSYTANMLAAYYSKGCDSHDLFSKLEISKEESYEKYINNFNVITLDIQSMIALNQGAKE